MTYIAAILTVLALLIVAGGFRFSRKSRRPKLLRVGAAVTGLGVVLLWLLPLGLFSVDRGVWAMPMLVAALFVAGSVLALGIQLIARACGAPEPSRNDMLFNDFIRHNDLP